MTKPAPEAAPLARVDMGEAARARDLLATPGVIALEIPRLPLAETAYQGFVRALLSAPPFKCDFNGQTADEALGVLADQLFGGGFAEERAVLAGEVGAMQAFAQAVGGGAPVITAVRNYFAPGDLVWHVDRSHQRGALRLVWPIGRPGGMRVTPSANIDPVLFRAFMSREYPLLYELDRRIMTMPGASLEALWAHRPRQVEALRAGAFPFLRDEADVQVITPGFASIHRIDTPYHAGTFHRSSWENRHAPGVQIVMTAGEP